MKTIYVVVECYNGTGYTGESSVLGSFEKLQTAIEYFEEVIADTQPSEPVRYEECKYIREDGCIIYELTNFDEDYHCYIKLEKTVLI